jgi:hypothetical protein
MKWTNNSKKNNEQKNVVEPDQIFKNSSGAPFIVLVAHHGGISVASLMVSSGAPGGAPLVFGLPVAQLHHWYLDYQWHRCTTANH